MTIRLWDNSSPSWTDFTVTSTTIYANQFSCDEARDVERIGWYRGATGTTWKPSRMGLFRADTQAQVIDVPLASVTDNGAVGWQWTDVSGQYTLVVGVTYVLAYLIETSVHQAFVGSTAWLAPDLPLRRATNARRFLTSATWAYPTGSDNVNAIGIDIEVSGSASAGSTVPSDIDSALAEWLSNDSIIQTHETNGLPWLTKQLLQSTYDLVSAINTRLAPAGGPLTVLTDLYLNNLKTQIDAQTALDALVSSRLTGASSGGGSAFYGPDGTQVAAGVEALLARSTNARVGFPASPWTLTDETDWDDAIAYAEPADLYVVTFTSTPPTIPDNGRAGVPVRYRLAWWTPLNGSFAQERRWIDFEKMHLFHPAGRMPGVLLQTYAGGAGHIQAWTLTV